MVEIGKSIFTNDGLAGLILILQVSDFLLNVVVLAFALNGLQQWFQRRKFGGWKIQIISATGEKVIWDIGMKKAEAIFDDPREMDIYLKGYASSNGFMKVTMSPNDPRAIKAGMLSINYDNRILYLDPSKDPGLQPKAS